MRNRVRCTAVFTTFLLAIFLFRRFKGPVGRVSGVRIERKFQSAGDASERGAV